MTMSHPGLPLFWIIIIGLTMAVSALWSLQSPPPAAKTYRVFGLQRLPLLGPLFAWLQRHSWPLLILKIGFAVLFLLVIGAGLWGTAIPERNLATTLTWNLWWSGVIIAILFTGSAWCAVCPWDNIASWLVKRRIWRKAAPHSSLNLSVPSWLRNLWPATVLFIALTWLELGVGIVTSPYTTALLALAMIVAATLMLALFENKAFCRYMCPVGRTIGVYSQLSPIALRSVDPAICKTCKSLACFHGTETIAPCPTGLIIGRLQESTYCTSCGNCSQSCPSNNVGWQIRPPSVEAIQDARPHIDEAAFMLVLLALTSFHGLTMLEGWQQAISKLGQQLGDSGQLLISFSLGLTVYTLIPIGLYGGLIYLTHWLLKRAANAQLPVKPYMATPSGQTAIPVKNLDSSPANRIIPNNIIPNNIALNNTVPNKKTPSFKKLFSGFAFATLPLAFCYHLAHNLNHLLRENNDWSQLLSNPLGLDRLPLSAMEKHLRHSELWLPQPVLFTLQASLIMIGFLLAVQIIRHRGYRLFGAQRQQLLPMLVFAVAVTSFNLWMMAQPMVMRM